MKKAISILAVSMLAVVALAIPPASASVYTDKQVVNGDLVITGSSNYDEVFISARGGGVMRVSYWYYFPNPAPGGPIDELRWDDFTGVTGDILVKLGNGFNTFRISDDSSTGLGIPGGVYYSGGSGQDNVTFSSASVPGTVEIGTGSGPSDTVQIINSKFMGRIKTSAASSGVTVSNSVFRDNFIFSGSSRADDLTISDSQFDEGLYVYSSGGSDTISISALAVNDVIVDTGWGSDSVEFDVTTSKGIAGSAHFDGGSSYDQLDLGSVSPKAVSIVDFEQVS